MSSLMSSSVLADLSTAPTLALLVLAISRTDKVDMYLDVFANELPAQEFASFLSIVSLLWVRKSASRP